MSQLPITPLSPEEQQGLMEQMYRLCGKQVQSYHKHHHMGSNSSVSMELAQELMESILYTTNLVGGVHAHKNTEDALILGQKQIDRQHKTATDRAVGLCALHVDHGIGMAHQRSDR